MARKAIGKAQISVWNEAETPAAQVMAGIEAGPQAITPVGGEVRVNTATAFNQISGKGAALAGGGFVVAWDDSSNSGGASGDTDGSVRVQLFDANGGKIGTDILANSATAGSQGRAAVTGLTNGGFVVTWEDYSHGVGGATGDSDQAAVKAQVFTAAGVKVGTEILVNSDPAGDQIAGPPVALSGGGFVVSWATFDGSQGQSVNLRAEVFAADGTRVATGLVVDDGFNGDATIIALDGNRFAVLSTEIGVTTPTVIGDREVQMRIYDGNGVPAGPAVTVNDADANWQNFDSVAKVAGGGFVVTWEEQDPGGSFSEIMAQRFDAAGAKIGTEFLVNTVTASYQFGSQVSGLAGGGFVITWGSQDPALGNEVRAQVYNAAGVAIGTELNVNSATASAQQAARVVALASGGFVVVWDDSSQGIGGATGDNNGRAIKGQEYDATGMTVGTEFLVNTAIRERQQITDVIALPNGRFAVIWDDASQGLGGATGDTSGLAVKLQVLQGTQLPAGTVGPDTIIGTSGNDTIDGLGGDDVLFGQDGGDTLIGGADNDYLDGQGGADVTRGGAGNDVHIVDAAGDVVEEGAGEGSDLVYTAVSYALAAGAEVETMSTRAHGGTAAIDLTGNDVAQTIIGNYGANVIDGRGGADTMYGLAGDDTYLIDNAGDLVIDGAGQGNDLVLASVSYTLANGNEIERLSAAVPTGTEAINLQGNDYANILTGNNGANYLNGNGGADTMIGLGGNDIYVVDTALDAVQEAAGGGSDLVYSFVSYTLAAGQEVEAISTAGQAATNALDLTGNEFGQLLVGNAGANVIDGKGGSDTLYGLGGADFFAFTTAVGAGNVDTIADFNVADDTIRLDDAVFTQVGGLGTLNASAFVTGSAATDADDRIIYDSATGALSYDADGSGAGVQVQFATLSTGLALTASDFVVF